ncbi:hypothetical protein Asp14428_10330 [Actinoplanes sp. NBRC 14428]|uniref:DoxX-like protein n=1 Tax=Pseudosporangium ferrugineum TaxID=439699 RepID=A0A2T0SFK2_9ACTN|nr:hypothetical protein [Pseudosporangium ferrugineum]PRY32197.1 hypothetical protein CLV70_102408 [Pseudosporangium ferrugineum]BCJ49558.1 hypothetical protein Asp14428_10330 [Actinoplanes sp. NBRC 14428]
MRGTWGRCAAAIGAAAAVLAVPSPASAHEKWFVPDPDGYPGDWSFVWRPLTLALILGVVLVTVVWRYVAVHWLPLPELRALSFAGRLVPYVPRLLAIHLGVSLLAAGVSGHFLTHDLEVGHLSGGAALLLLEGALGVWFITGIRLRPAAVGLALAGPLALLVTGPVGLLSALDLLGVAVFLAFVPPSDATFGRVEPDAVTLRRALLALRLGAGGALITLAFAEKLANPALARETLRMFPQLDVFAAVGIHLPPDTFVAVAGATELLFGLLVISGALPQVAVLVAGIPFNATLLLFGGTELLGHLPVYGVFLTLLAYGSNARTAGQVRWLPRNLAAIELKNSSTAKVVNS